MTVTIVSMCSDQSRVAVERNGSTEIIMTFRDSVAEKVAEEVVP